MAPRLVLLRRLISKRIPRRAARPIWPITTVCFTPIRSSAPSFTFIDPAGNPVAARVSGNLVTTSIVVMRTAAVAGLGLWLCPPYIVSDLLASGALVPLLPDYGRPEMEIVALYPHRRQLSAKVRLFLDMLVDRFAEEQRWLDATPDPVRPEWPLSARPSRSPQE